MQQTLRILIKDTYTKRLPSFFLCICLSLVCFSQEPQIKSSPYSYDNNNNWGEALDSLVAIFNDEWKSHPALGVHSYVVKEAFRRIETEISNMILSIEVDYSYKLPSPRSYEDYILVLDKWRNFIKNVESKCGIDGLYKLKKYVLSHIKVELIDDADNYACLFSWDKDKLSYLSKSYYDECIINIRFNKLAEFKTSYRALREGLELDNQTDDISLIQYKIVGSLSSELEGLGYYDWADALWSQLWEYSYEHNREYCEKIKNKVCSLALKRNDFVRLGGLVSIDRYIVEEVTNYKNFFFMFYDAQTLVERLILMSRIYSEINKPEMRSRALKIAEEIMEEDVVLKNGKPISKNTKSALYNTLGVYAEDAINQLKYYERSLKYNSNNAILYLNLAQAYSNLGEYEKSDSIALQRLEFLNQYSDDLFPEQRRFLYRLLGENAIMRDDKTDVKEYLGKYLSATIRDYLNASQTMTSHGRKCYWEHYSTTLPYFSSIDYNCGIDASNSYNAALFQKSILIRQQMAIKEDIVQSDDEALKNAYERYNQKVRSEADSTYSKSEAEYMYLYSLHPEFVQSFKIPKWQDIRERLIKNELAIEFSVGSDTLTREAYYMAILLGKKYDNPKIIRLCKRSELDSLFNKNIKRGGFSMSLYKDKTLIYNYIWKPIEKYLKGIRTIYYAPYGLLNNINIEIAQKKQNSKSIGEQYRLYRLMTTASLTDEHTDSFADATLWGDIDYNAQIFESSASIDSAEFNDIYANVRGNMRGPWKELQGMKTEILEVDCRLKAGRISSAVYSGNLATEGTVKLLSGNSSNIMHIATHGYYYNSDEAPASGYFEHNKETKIDSQERRAGLILAGANHAWTGESVPRGVDDGILTSDEILGLDFSRTRLLVLSACQTALGDIKSDGIYGLQSSFKIAGVGTIVMSLWEVDDDATFTMMSKFYELLSNGKERHFAFREAQSYTKSWAERMIQDGNLSDYFPPEYYWAAFIMMD